MSGKTGFLRGVCERAWPPVSYDVQSLSIIQTVCVLPPPPRPVAVASGHRGDGDCVCKCLLRKE